MITLHIEHEIRDFDTWKAAFDSDPARRAEAGVRRYVIRRPVDRPLHMIIDLEFDDRRRADAMLAVLENMWRSPRAISAVSGPIGATILERVEARDL